jgi:hypothetical protein
MNMSSDVDVFKAAAAMEMYKAQAGGTSSELKRSLAAAYMALAS